MTFEEKLFVSRHVLQQKTYYLIRAKYPSLSSQMVLHCVFKVFDSYKKVRKLAAEEITRRVFRPLGAIAYDDRILTFKEEASMVSIMTVKGREKIPYVLGPDQREMLQFRKGESDLCLVKGKWFLNVACGITPEGRVEPEDMIGVDLGIRRLAVYPLQGRIPGSGRGVYRPTLYFPVLQQVFPYRTGQPPIPIRILLSQVWSRRTR